MSYKFSKIPLSSIFISLLCSIGSSFADAPLTPDERKQLHDYVQSVPIEDGIGQLLIVGVAADIGQPNLMPEDIEIFTSLGVGGAFLNSYNYFMPKYTEERRDDYLLQIAWLHLRLQKLASDSVMRLPLLLAVDFEGPNLTSIPYGLYSAPPALTLGATASPDLVNLSGRLVGHELSALGIHLLAGPVLDVDISEQGKYNAGIQNRSFSSSAHLVQAYASQFINGLNQSNVTAIVKHFPGLGNTDGDIDGIKLPSYKGSFVRLNADLAPYPSLRDLVGGIMTSHLSLSDGLINEPKPVTFSRLFSNDVVRDTGKVKIGENELDALGYQDHVVLTDDLSSVNCITSYMQKEGKTYGDIACEALDAGHDLLLFSHVEIPTKPKRGSCGSFDMAKLKQVRESLLRHIQSSDGTRKRFYESLERVILLKASLAAKSGVTFSQFLQEPARAWSIEIGSIPKSLDCIDFLRPYSADGNPKEFLRKVYEKATLLLSDCGQQNPPCFDLSKLHPNAKVAFCADDVSLRKYQDQFGSSFNTTLIPAEFAKKKDYQKYVDSVRVALQVNERLIVSVRSPDDANMVHSLVLSERQRCKDCLVVVMQTTPKLLPIEVFDSATVLGSFSGDQIATDVILDVLKGILKPGPLENLPIGLGVNGSIVEPKFDEKAITTSLPKNGAQPEQTTKAANKNSLGANRSFGTFIARLPIGLGANLLTVGLILLLWVAYHILRAIKDKAAGSDEIKIWGTILHVLMGKILFKMPAFMLAACGLVFSLLGYCLMADESIVVAFSHVVESLMLFK